MKNEVEIISLLKDGEMFFPFLATYKNGKKEAIYNCDIELYADCNDVTKQYICPSNKNAKVMPDDRNNAQGYFKFENIVSQNIFLSEYEIIDLNILAETEPE